MTRNKVVLVLLTVGLVTTWLLAGCSDDKSTTAPSTTLAVALPAFDELIEVVTPPVFTGSTALLSPLGDSTSDTSYGYWAQGDSPLLGRVFGETEPMALYRNTYRLGETVRWLNRVRRVGDTAFTGVQTDSGEFSGTISVQRLNGSVEIPEACKAVLGETPLNLRYRVQVTLNEQTETRLQAGFRQDDTCDLMLAYYGGLSPDSAHPEAYEYCLMYAYRHRVRDSLQVRAVNFRAYNDPSGQCAMWVYEVNSQSGGQFCYRMSWYADDFADSSGIGCLVGCGNRQTQFALRYQQMIPADRLEPDSLDPHGHLHRVFGANYSDQGATLTVGWDAATDPSKMYRYEHMPVILRSNPGLAESAIDPWHEN